MTSADTTTVYQGDLRRLTLTIRAAIMFFGVLLILVIAFAGWSANKSATDRERTLLENAFNQSIARMLNEQKSVAWWDDAVTKITDKSIDLDFADSNFGIFLTETYGHNEVYILDRQDQPIYAFADSKRGEPKEFERRRANLSEVISEIRTGTKSSLRTRPDEFGASQTNYRLLAGAVESARWAGHILSIGDKPAVVSAITIVPNVEMSLLKGPPNLLISVRYIDERFIGGIARSLLIPDLTLAPKPVKKAGIIAQSFSSDDGSDAGVLSWTTRQPGRVLLTIILPLVASGVLATGVLSSNMFRRLRFASDELTQREAKARYASKHDALSGLPNRPHIVEKIETWISEHRSGNERLKAVAAYIDVDRFKDINDTMGHETGDKLIKAVAHRLTRRLRDDDFLARFGGDEFSILCATDDPEGGVMLAERIRNAFHEPFVIEGQSVRITASVGIAVAPDHGNSADELMRHADIALYEAKSLGRDRAVFFSADMASEVETRRDIEVNLRSALENDELRLNYQPIICCRTGKITGAEALLRWRTADGKDMSPATFIPVAENAGLMPALGEWVLDRAMRDSKLWPDLEIAVNLSPVQFRHVDLEALLRELTEKHDVKPSRFVLEVTEGVLLDATEHTKAMLRATQAMGFKTALDDFGTGYSSLAYLCNFSFDKIKIDRSFVSNMSKAVASRTIAQSVVQLGRGLGMKIVAEGVETEYQALLMSKFGCTELQGYHFSKAIEPDRLTELLETFEPVSLPAPSSSMFESEATAAA